MVQPAGAERWDVSEDGLVYTFHLRDNKYANGNSALAQDYANILVRTLDPEVASTYAATYYFIECVEAYNTGTGAKEDAAIKALDEKILEIKLTKPIPYFTQMMTSMQFTPIQEEHTEGDKNISYGADTKNMSFSGLFLVEDWTIGQGFVLKKNPEYWDATSVNLDTINYLLVQETNTQQLMFEQGKVDILENITAEYMDKSAQKMKNNEIRLFEYAKQSLLYLSFNNQDPEGIFTNAKIRQAFSLAIDRETYVEKVLKKDSPA